VDTLRARVQSLSRLFKYEFMFRVDASFDEIFDEVLEDMVATGELQRDDGLVQVGPGHDGLDGRGWINFHAAVLRNFLESYRVAARAVPVLLRKPLPEKDLSARALRFGERMFLEGEIGRSEAVSGPPIDNALKSFCDQGYLVREGKELRLARSFRSDEAARAIEARIAAYLPRRQDDG
jgi:glycerol-3-phosphate O-acyltransferase